ncbi:MAG: type II toxin-antitoxin system RelE/ParE family toxin [Acidobacteria bacterium]|nr:type II toxin-antitoxin system RelE/ParE family toxin [Acidobacteriota bacterium]
MTYSLRIKASAAKSLKKISRTDRLRIIDAIDRLRDEPTAGGVLKGEFSGLRRLRVADYRVIYEVSAGELVILIVRIGHRKEVYR